ncbi:precorrin-6A/cobalt-precorrin-6A reductase, partial [Pseudomonas aeruginosa]|uniref:precorrin-6A/cobalt-precorrin-6A reductase n=1 Tax=Pseudomonas aeruginosa TaxID=287 RepID=UPI0020C75E59
NLAQRTEALEGLVAEERHDGVDAVGKAFQVPPHQHWTVRCLQGQPAAPRAEVIGARGPFSLDGERALFERLACDVLVSKNSGSQATEPKLQVAREMGLPVLVLARPALPPADREFADGEALLTAIRDWESA